MSSWLQHYDTRTYDDATPLVDFRYDGLLVSSEPVFLHLLLHLLVNRRHLTLQLWNDNVLGAPLPVLGLREGGQIFANNCEGLRGAPRLRRGP